MIVGAIHLLMAVPSSRTDASPGGGRVFQSDTRTPGLHPPVPGPNHELSQSQHRPPPAHT